MTASLRMSEHDGGAERPGASAVCLTADRTLRDAFAGLERTGKGALLATDSEGRLLGLITDGELRRAFLGGDDLETPLHALLDGRAGEERRRTVPVGSGPSAVLKRMRQEGVRELAVVDAVGHVAGLVTEDDLVPDAPLPVRGVLMAGGFGTRLRPLTNAIPKPMLPIGGRPLMELAVTRMRQSGIRRISVTTHYMPAKIAEHFGDGAWFGVELDYVNEESPLGTAGALTLLGRWDEPVLVMNGDLLTTVNFRSVFRYHRERDAVLTVAVRPYEVQVPYGVVDCEGGSVRRIREKPTYPYLINAGIYLIEPSAREYIPAGRRFDMPDLIARLIDDGRTVAGFPVLEYWLDIGKLTDYEQAQRDVQEGRVAA